MSDARTRELERLAAGGDPEAERALARKRSRDGGHPFASLIGEWVLMPGAAWNVYGLVREYRVLPGGETMLALGPCWDGDYVPGKFESAMPIGSETHPAWVTAAHVSYFSVGEMKVIEMKS